MTRDPSTEALVLWLAPSGAQVATAGRFAGLTDTHILIRTREGLKAIEMERTIKAHLPD